ncbi:MAG: prolipoprotein diacylglyceryl transferase [Acidobacteriota bacterium]
MHPVLFTLPVFGRHLEIPTYGVLLAAAFLLVLKAAGRLARREGIDPRTVTDYCLATFLSGLLGAKVLLIILDLPYYWRHPGDLLGTIRSAGVFYGGLLAGIPVGIWFVRRRRLPLWKMADIAGACAPIGLSIGRLGCLAAGCCFGKPTHLPWAITFTLPATARATGVPLDQPLHPTQIYLSLNALVLAVLLLAFYRHKKYDGQIFLWFVILYGATRTFWELFRGDDVRGFLVPGVISTSQAIGSVSMVTAIIVLILRRRQLRRS